MPKIYGKMVPDYGHPLVDAVAVDADAVKDDALGSFQSQINAAAFEVGSDGRIKIKSDALPVDTQLNIQVVASLPETGDARTIYLVPSPDGTDDNTHEEYVWVNKAALGDPDNYAWERIGAVSINNESETFIVEGNTGHALSDDDIARLKKAKFLIIKGSDALQVVFTRSTNVTNGYIGLWVTYNNQRSGLYTNVSERNIEPYHSIPLEDMYAVKFNKETEISPAYQKNARHNINAAANGLVIHITGTSNSLSLGGSQGSAEAHEAIVANTTGTKLRINYIDSESIGWPFAAEAIQRSEIVEGESTTYYLVTGIGQISDAVYQISFKATYTNETLSITDSVLEKIGSTEQYDLQVSPVTGTSTNDTNKAAHDLLAAGSFPRITINDGVETYAVTSYAHAEPVLPETTSYYILSVDGAYGSNIESVSGARIYEKKFKLDATGKLSRYKVQAADEVSEHDPLLIDGLAKQSDIDDINQVLFTQYTAATLTRTPAVIERGVSKEITLTWATRFNGKAETPTSLSIKKGTTVLTSEAKADGSVKDSISETTTYNLTAVVKGVTKTASATVNAYYPKYFGCHAVDGVTEQITAAIVTGLVKQALTNTAVGSYSIPVAESNATYVWLCVPNSMSITEVMAGGLEFDLYQETPNVNMAFEVNVNGVAYKCYRSKNKPNAGTINIQITK